MTNTTSHVNGSPHRASPGRSSPRSPFTSVRHDDHQLTRHPLWLKQQMLLKAEESDSSSTEVGRSRSSDQLLSDRETLRTRSEERPAVPRKNFTHLKISPLRMPKLQLKPEVIPQDTRQLETATTTNMDKDLDLEVRNVTRNLEVNSKSKPVTNNSVDVVERQFISKSESATVRTGDMELSRVEDGQKLSSERNHQDQHQSQSPEVELRPRNQQARGLISSRASGGGQETTVTPPLQLPARPKRRSRAIQRSFSEVGDSSTALRCRAILRSHSFFLEVCCFSGRDVRFRS